MMDKVDPKQKFSNQVKSAKKLAKAEEIRVEEENAKIQKERVKIEAEIQKERLEERHRQADVEAQILIETKQKLDKIKREASFVGLDETPDEYFA